MKRLIIGIILLLMIGEIGQIYARKTYIRVNHHHNTVTIEYNNMDYANIKIMIKKGTTKYYYNIYDAYEVFPLQMGNGIYRIALYKRIRGNQYEVIHSNSYHITDYNEDIVFTGNIQSIEWTSMSLATVLAKELTVDLDSDRARFEAIYKYVVDNIEYDTIKAELVDNRYIPVPDEVITAKKGICYDYASLLAVMLRSINIPTKLVHGYCDYSPIYHAWNEVKLDEEWVIIDTTYDASRILEILPETYEKNPEYYHMKKIF